MRTDVFQLEPAAFAAALRRQTLVWKRAAGTTTAGSRRHWRSLRREWIRQYKRRTGIDRLPEPLGPLNGEEQWQEPPATELKLVFLPPEQTLADRREMRKTLRRILFENLKRRYGIRLDLVNAANAIDGDLPDVGLTETEKHLHLRGIYLEGLGAAILPDLTQQQVATLQQAGIEVTDNTPFAALEPEDGRTDGGVYPGWHMERINIEAARRKNLSGKGIRIGIMDSGIDADHSCFAGRQITFRAFYPKGSRKLDQTPRDFGQHGTHVAALCAGNTGVASEAHLVVAAVLTEKVDDRLIGYPAQIAAALNWMVDAENGRPKRVDVINASLGGPLASSSQYRALLRAARAAGTLTVAAVGNDGGPEGNHLAPAAYDFVLAVGAVDHKDEIYHGSAWGRAWTGKAHSERYKPDIVAPGVDITSAVPGNETKRLTGTSMACPLVTGTAALLLQQDGELRADSDGLVDRLLRLTYSSPEMRKNSVPVRFGAGRLDLGNI